MHSLALCPHRFALILTLSACAMFALQQRVQATASGLNNIPTADTAPNLTLVLPEYSTFGARREPDHTAGFKFGIDPWETSEWRNRSKQVWAVILLQAMPDLPSFRPSMPRNRAPSGQRSASASPIDNLSGQQAFKCFACRVRKA